MSKMRYIRDGRCGHFHRIIMSHTSIWRCQHECDRRECQHCFAANEFDRLVEGRFKSYNNSSDKTTKRQYESDRAVLPHADTKSNEYESHNRRRKSGHVGDDSLYAVGDRFGRSIQSVPGILSPNERHTFSYYPESKSITTATDNVLHRINTSTHAHHDDIDYESKSCY